VTKEVKMVTPILPPEATYRVGYPNLELLAIRDGTELLLYGDNSNIWKYSVAKNSWEMAGQILLSRDRPLVIEAPGLHCP
jgi:hypothetical protein